MPVAASAEAGFDAEISALTPVARSVAAALRLCAGVGLLWLGLRWLSGDLEAGSLAQLRLFFALVIAPSLAAWAIARAGAARVRVQADALVLELRDRRIEIPVSRLAALQPWRWPLPAPGASLRLASGQTLSQGLAGIDASRVAGLIALTARHGALGADDFPRTPEGEDTRRFLDCDMAILGAEPEAFAVYDRAIAEEYRAVPRWLYRRKRRAFFRGLIDRERIFLSDFFRDRLEAAARRNLRAMLSDGDKIAG